MSPAARSPNDHMPSMPSDGQPDEDSSTANPWQSLMHLIADLLAQRWEAEQRAKRQSEDNSNLDNSFPNERRTCNCPLT